MRGGTVCTLLHPSDPPQGRGTHTHTDDWRYRPRLCTAGILSHSAVADLERGGEGGLVLLLVGRRCVGGLRRDGQALAYKGERETVL